MDGNQLTKLLECTITILGIIVTVYLVPALQSKIKYGSKLEQIKTLLIWTEKCVQAAEQLFVKKDYEKKKAYVIECMKSLLDKGDGINVVNVKLSDKQLDTLIEAVVREVKHVKNAVETGEN